MVQIFAPTFLFLIHLYFRFQGASSPDITTVYVDRVSLRNDRVNLLERGSPNSLCLMESGKAHLRTFISSVSPCMLPMNSAIAAAAAAAVVHCG
ncbi:unnamed protein product [Rodentolepis nana]|uniref:Secreted protein n=1 Tax=Rodentolepis nana TaxID=102285 RepID=A0A0R3TG01_RODNA|nr:unnamed protein product [Rodentolepis nana]